MIHATIISYIFKFPDFYQEIPPRGMVGFLLIGEIIVTNLSRRDFFGKTALGIGAGLAFSNSWASALSPKTFSKEEADVVVELTAMKKNLEVLTGKYTNFWSYSGELIKGPAHSLTAIPNSYHGPTIEVKTGDRVKIIFKNAVDEKSIVHWHGLDVSHENDGHPHFAVESGKSYEYDFEVVNRAGMYWYHPHPHGRTGFQVYQGMAGLFVVRDREEAELELPAGEFEKRFVIQDRLFKDNGELDYRPSMMGAFGDTLMINGEKKPEAIKVKRGTYRFRLLNGCNARIFNLALSSKDSFTQIGSDGGLLEKAVELKRFYYGPAERVDLLVDFSKNSVGEIVELEGLPLVEGRGEKYTVLKFEVVEGKASTFESPETLCKYEVINESEAVNAGNPKKFELIPKRGVGWTISGRAYEHNDFHEDEIINFGDTEVWEFYNPTGMPHPMHVHGTPFQVLNREVGRLDGCLNEGWKDVVLVMPGDRVQVIKRFNTFKGIFIYHCHNLEHEDMSMMRNFKII